MAEPMFETYNPGAKALDTSSYPTANGHDELLDHWARQLRHHLSRQWLQVVVSRTPPYQSPGNNDMRHAITINRDHDDKVLITGVIRPAATDKEAIQVAAAEAYFEYTTYIDVFDRLGIPPVEIEVFFLCDEQISIWRIDCLPDRKWEPELVDESGSRRALVHYLARNLLVLGCFRQRELQEIEC